MDDIATVYDPKYFSFTKLEKQINLKEDPETFDEARQRQEFLKCANDFAYFCHRYVKIKDWRRNEVVPFVLYNHQRRSIAHSLGNRFAAIIKPRQMGLSLVYQAFALWRGLFRYGERIMVLTGTDRMAIDRTYNLKIMLDNLPSWLKPVMSRMNDHEAHFADSDTHIYNYTWEACCGRAIDWLILDEASIHRNLESSWLAVLPTIATGGRCIAFSSMVPHASGWSWWEKVVSGNLEDKYFFGQPAKFPFETMELSYREHPEYDSEEWARKIEAQMGSKAFRTEVLCQRPEKEVKKVAKPKVVVEKDDSIHIHVHHHHYHHNDRTDAATLRA